MLADFVDSANVGVGDQRSRRLDCRTDWLSGACSLVIGNASGVFSTSKYNSGPVSGPQPESNRKGL